MPFTVVLEKGICLWCLHFYPPSRFQGQVSHDDEPVCIVSLILEREASSPERHHQWEGYIIDQSHALVVFQRVKEFSPHIHEIERPWNYDLDIFIQLHLSIGSKGNWTIAANRKATPEPREKSCTFTIMSIFLYWNGNLAPAISSYPRYPQYDVPLCLWFIGASLPVVLSFLDTGVQLHIAPPARKERLADQHRTSKMIC